MTQCATCVGRLYQSIIDEVVDKVRDKFLDEGIDEQVLMEMKQGWEQKLAATRATDHYEKTGGQQQQELHQQVASGLTGQPAQSGAAAAAPAAQPTPPTVNLVPVQITVPAQQAGGTPKTITIHVPSSALSNGVAGSQLQEILSAPSAANTFALEANRAAAVIQRQLNEALQRRGIALPPQLIRFASTAVDGAFDLPTTASRTHRNTCLCPNTELARNRVRKHLQTARTARLIMRQRADNTDEVSGRVPDADFQIVNSSGAAADSSYEADISSDEARPSSLVRVKADTDAMDAALLSRLADIQVDGAYDDTSDEMSADDDEEDEDKEEEEDKDKKFLGEEDEDEEEEPQDTNEDPLNSNDDVSDEDMADTTDPENVVVCQYDKINRVRNKWKFNLKDGIMNLKGKDYVFMRATGEGEW